ncbi:hypothetical protein DMB95_04445 [Campylobacter sp. MIT 12-8780]|uniref:CDC27 family protein n=1 Tax=unclassified Campylobacter TaxID=2593542 RepID=UPI00115DB12D|nr:MULTISPECIES: CDC27 family protein [unclassified Campylobacter]NDJ27100.1 hypothetical protein [Campylobacter sp. MIT 19-121]TQR41600.1 hypothetical protein DMB95_04445 [Campylobacter sp. MIT 12-8780]
MTEYQLQELEQKYKAYKFKHFALKFAYLALCAGSLAGVFFFLQEQNLQKERIKIALHEKNKMLQRLELAKAKLAKEELLAKINAKDQALNLAPLSPQKKVILKSYPINPAKLKAEFYAKENTQSALKLASFHLENKDYEKAIFWALKANSLDAKEPNSWLIFARAKNLQGKKEEGLKALENYLSFYGSDDMQNFILD